MSIKKIIFSALLASGLLVLIRRVLAKPASVQPYSSSDSCGAIDAYVEGQMRHLDVPGISLAIVEGDRIVHLRGFGHTCPGGDAPTPQTPFFIGSVTKSFTALAIMQLVEAGNIELDAPIQRYLPWFRVVDPEASARITVRHLLNHTSGMSVLQGQLILAELEDGPDAMERQLRALSTLKLSHPVGSKFQYNNTNYNLLGLIVEVVSGESYADYIQKHIFDPLDMAHSYTSKAEAQKNGLAIGHRYWFGRPIPAPNLPIPRGSLPSGQLISCAEDMAHYLIAQLNGGRYGSVQILSKAGIDEMHRGTTQIIEMGFLLGSYAMGWERHVTGNTTIVSHSGIVPDFGAFAALVPEQKKGIVLLYNANHAMIKMTLDEFGSGAAQRLAGETPSKTVFGAAPLLMRSLVLIPVLQAADVAATLRRVKHWHLDPANRPTRGRMWRRHILLPLLPNLLVALSLFPTLGKMRGWMLLFMPDLSWIARINGGLAAIWIFLRTGLILRTAQKTGLPESSVGRPSGEQAA